MFQLAEPLIKNLTEEDSFVGGPTTLSVVALAKLLMLMSSFAADDVGGGVDIGPCESTVDILADDDVVLPTLLE